MPDFILDDLDGERVIIDPDSGNFKKLWSEEKCYERILKLLLEDHASEAARNARYLEFWNSAAESIKKQPDDLSMGWMTLNYLRLEDAWNKLHGEETEGEERRDH